MFPLLIDGWVGKLVKPPVPSGIAVPVPRNGAKASEARGAVAEGIDRRRLRDEWRRNGDDQNRQDRRAIDAIRIVRMGTPRLDQPNGLHEAESVTREVTGFDERRQSMIDAYLPEDQTLNATKIVDVWVELSRESF
jgi:hypothetical protein